MASGDEVTRVDDAVEVRVEDEVLVGGMNGVGEDEGKSIDEEGGA